MNKFAESYFLFTFYIFAIIVFYLMLPTDCEESKLFYVTTISASFFLAWLSQLNYSKPLNLFFYWSSFSVLLFVLGFRDLTGIDDYQYQIIFEDVRKFGLVQHFVSTTQEPGYLLANYLIGLFTGNYYIAQFIFSFVALFLFYKSLKKYKDYISVPLSVLLFLSFFYFQMISVSLIRMFIALGIVFYSLDFLIKDKPFKYLFAIIVAATIHYSALFMLIFFFLSLKRDYIYKYWKTIIIYIYISMPIIFFIVSKIAGAILGERFDAYTKITGGDINLMMFSTIPILIIFLIIKKHIPSEKIKLYTITLILFSLAPIIDICNTMVPLGRTIFYSYIGIIILFPTCYRYSKSGISRILLGFIIISYSLLYVFTVQFNNNAVGQTEHLFPYKNILFRLN